DEFRIKTVAGRLVNRLAAERAPELIFVIIVAAEAELFAIRRKFLLFVEHDELGGSPRLPGLAHVTPELEDRTFEIAVPDKVIAGRFRGDALGRLGPGLFDS